MISWLLIISCTSKTQQETPVEPQEQEIAETYSLTGETAYIKWTAYKFTERAGVSGTFDSIFIEAVNREGTVEEILQDTEFRITTRSVNTNMPMRDDRIYNSLFETIGAETISGKFDEANDSEGAVTINLGDHGGQAPFAYTVSDDTISITTSIDLAEWQAQNGVDALNEVCKVEHTGTDGVSKLWPDVDITVKVPVRSTSR